MRPLLAATAILVLVAVYVLHCWVWPMRDCWCCKGNGHHRPAGDHKTHRRGKVSRPCRWCKQTGKRLRIGRRVWNRIRRKYRAAQ